MGQLLLVIMQVILAPLGWFVDILTASGAYGIFLALFAAGVVVRLFIKPILGGSGKGAD